MMKSNVYKLTEIDNEIIDLYIECFKKDKIFVSRDKDILNDRESIIKLFNYCIKYGTILYTKRYSKKISRTTSIVSNLYPVFYVTGYFFKEDLFNRKILSCKSVFI